MAFTPKGLVGAELVLLPKTPEPVAPEPKAPVVALTPNGLFELVFCLPNIPVPVGLGLLNMPLPKPPEDDGRSEAPKGEVIGAWVVAGWEKVEVDGVA